MVSLFVGLFGKKEINRLFVHKTLSVVQLVDKIKLVSWWWLKTRNMNLIMISTYDDLIWSLACLEVKS
jgi:hypothetical protein